MGNGYHSSYGDDSGAYDDGYLNQVPDENPNGPQTSQNSAGKWSTTYRLSQPLTAAQIAQMRSSVNGAGLSGGGVTVSPDGLTVTIQAAQTKNELWKYFALFAAIIVTAGIAATVVGGGEAAAAASLPTTVGTGGTLAATQTVPLFGSTVAGGTGLGTTAATTAAAGGTLAATQTVPLYGGTVAGSSGAGAGLVGAGSGAGADVGAGAGRGGAMGWKSTAIDKGTDLFSSLFQSRAQNKANDKATDAAAQAQRYAADVQKQAADDALAFQREQARQALYSNEAARKGNYGIWSAGQRRLGTLSELAGFGKREIPDYVPDPGVSGGGSGAMYPSRPENMPKAGEVDWSSPQLGSQLSAYYKARGVADSEVPYWVQHAAELVARGKEINNPNYANERLAASEIFGGGARPASPGNAARRRSLLDYATTPRRQQMTPPLGV